MTFRGVRRAKNKLRATGRRSADAQQFSQAFAPLETSLTRRAKMGGTVMTPEQMIVELHLTPLLVRQIEGRFRIRLPWFKPTYANLKRHGLMPRERIPWEEWLKDYRKRRAAACRGRKTSAKRGVS